MISASAPIKIILIGEHAVVHGTPAISLPLPFFTTVTLESQNSDEISITSNQPLSEAIKLKLQEQVRLILQYIAQKEIPDIKVSINLSVPAGIGFGISASVAVALVKAFCKFFQQELSEKALFEIVQKLEEKNHGQPSGIDHTTIIYNVPVLFQKRENSGKLQITRSTSSGQANNELQVQKIPELWSEEIFKNLYLINTGEPRERTKEMVDFVANRFHKFPHHTEILFQKIKKLVPTVQSALKQNDQAVFRDALNEAGSILEELGIVSERVKEISSKIREAGGMAKISGAGGRKGDGSGILLVWHEGRDFIADICRKCGFEYWHLGT